MAFIMRGLAERRRVAGTSDCNLISVVRIRKHGNRPCRYCTGGFAAAELGPAAMAAPLPADFLPRTAVLWDSRTCTTRSS